jgi:hypothetical protein
MRNGSIAEDVIMQIGGWQTAEVFKRYSIKDQHDTDAAIRKLEKKATLQATFPQKPCLMALQSR